MSDYRIPDAAEVESAFRSAHRALEPLLSSRRLYAHEDSLALSEVISLLQGTVDEAKMAAAMQLGPIISWKMKEQSEFGLVVASAWLDDDGTWHPDVELPDSAFWGADGGWSGGSLDQAARAYRREAGWDFAPGESGLWLLMLAPYAAYGGDETSPWFYSGHLAGFVILYDRDEDGAYEAVGHVWTAAAWRRQRIAWRLLQEAKSLLHFNHIEGPYSADGSALVEAWNRDGGTEQ